MVKWGKTCSSLAVANPSDEAASMAACGACGAGDIIMNELAGCGHALCNVCLASSSSSKDVCCPQCKASGAEEAAAAAAAAAALGGDVVVVHELPINKEQYASALSRRISDREDRREQYLRDFLRLGTVFVHIPKTAGTSVESVLFPSVGRNRSQHAPVGYWRARVAERGGDWSSIFSFAVVRDPYDRFVSAYSYWLAGGLAGQAVDLAFSRRVRRCAGMLAFVEYLHTVHLKGAWDDQDIQGYDGSCPTQFRPQTHFLGLKIDASAGPVDYASVRGSVDFLGRYERLDEDFRHVLRRVNERTAGGSGGGAAAFDERVPLPHRRVSIHVREQLPEELQGCREAMDRLYEIYQHDFLAFGYLKR